MDAAAIFNLVEDRIGHGEPPPGLFELVALRSDKPAAFVKFCRRVDKRSGWHEDWKRETARYDALLEIFQALESAGFDWA